MSKIGNAIKAGVDPEYFYDKYCDSVLHGDNSLCDCKMYNKRTETSKDLDKALKKILKDKLNEQT